MRLYSPVDLTVNLIMIEKLVLGEIWTGDLLILSTLNLFSSIFFLMNNERDIVGTIRDATEYPD